MEIPRFAGTRVTQRRRVHFARRQTLRRQVGGADPATTLPAISDTVSPLIEANPALSFLLTPNWWDDIPNAAMNYVTLIRKQDELLNIGLAAVLDKLGIDSNSDTYDADVLNALIDPAKAAEKRVCRQILLDMEKRIAFIAFRECANNAQGRFESLLSKQLVGTSAAQETTLNGLLAPILLNPMTIQNMAVHALVGIFKTLKSDATTLALLRDGSNPTKHALVMSVLRDKYVSFMYETARAMTGKTLKDNFYIWGCALVQGTGYENFVTNFLETVAAGTDEFNLKENITKPIEPPAQLGTSVQYSLSPSPKKLGEVAGVMFNNFLAADATMLSILEIFADRDATPFDAEAVGRAEIPVTIGAPLIINDLPGILPTINWDAPVIQEDTTLKLFHLMRKVDPPHLHFILHFLDLLFRPEPAEEEEEEGAGGGGAGAGAGGGEEE